MAINNDATAASITGLGQRFEAITHNLANSNTVGFKRLRTNFQQVLGAASASGASSGGKLQASSTIDFLQGGMSATGSNLDLAINGKGFFVLQSPQGPVYTRNGMFATNAQGQLVDTSGRTVSGDNGPIVIPTTVSPDSIHVGADGTVTAGGKAVGKINVVSFADSSVLMPCGSSGFTASDTSKMAPATSASVKQGYLENSNVNPVEELTGLITVTRMYEANMKTITSTDERLQTLVQVASA